MKIKRVLSMLTAAAILTAAIPCLSASADTETTETTVYFDATSSEYDYTKYSSSITDVWTDWTLSDGGSATYVTWGNNTGLNHTSGTLTSPGYAKGEDGYTLEFILGKAKKSNITYDYHDVVITDADGNMVYGYCYAHNADGFYPGDGERSAGDGSTVKDTQNSTRLKNYLKEEVTDQTSMVRTDGYVAPYFTNDTSVMKIEVENHTADDTITTDYYTVKYTITTDGNADQTGWIATEYYSGSVNGFGGISVKHNSGGDAGYANMKISSLSTEEETTPDPTETDEPEAEETPAPVNGVTTTETVSEDETTKTVVQSRTTPYENCWCYIGTVDDIENLTALSVSITGANGNKTGTYTGSNVGGSITKQTFEDETEGTISNSNYNGVFSGDGIVLAHDASADPHTGDILTAVQKLSSTGPVYLYAWVASKDAAITLTATYNVSQETPEETEEPEETAEPTYGITTTEEEDVTACTKTTTQTRSTDGEAWVYVGKVLVNENLKSVTVTMPTDSYANYAATVTMAAFSDTATGSISQSDYNSIFGSGELARRHNNGTGNQESGAVVDVTDTIRSIADAGETAYIYAWVANATTNGLKVTAEYDYNDVTTTVNVTSLVTEGTEDYVNTYCVGFITTITAKDTFTTDDTIELSATINEVNKSAAISFPTTITLVNASVSYGFIVDNVYESSPTVTNCSAQIIDGSN